MRVFAFEHICGGGLTRGPLMPTLLPLGAKMLRAAVGDFLAARCDVVTCLDARVAELWRKQSPRTASATECDATGLKGAHIELVEAGSPCEPVFERLARSADAVLVIAPETDGLLETWARRLRDWNVRSLGSSPEAIAACSDKFALSFRLASAGIRTPPTRLGAGPMKHSDGVYPLIVKPRFGAGCAATHVIRDAGQFDSLPSRNDWMTQPFVPGQAGSVAFLVRAGRATPLLAGEQTIAGDTTLAYGGGRIPITGERATRIITLAQRAIEATPGLHGFVGVDVVIGDFAHGDHVIEINPRLTVAYHGLRQLAATNLAAAMLDPKLAIEWIAGKSVAFDATS